MNPNTWISFATSVIGMAGAAAATDGLISGKMSQTIASAATMLLPLIWGKFIHRDTKVVQTAAAIPGVLPIQIGPTAEPALQKMAIDPATPSIVVAPPQPFVSSTIQQRR